jgi:hypothetical protein
MDRFPDPAARMSETQTVLPPDKAEPSIKELKALLVQCAEAIAYCHAYRINDSTIAEHRELMQRVREIT